MIQAALILQSLESIVVNFLRNIRIVDILDIALVACILYFILNWIRQSVSGRSIIGFSILILIYVVARLTGMYLTELLIEAFFFIIIIGAIIIFQSDIRRMIDRMGNWNIFGKGTSTSFNATNIITEAAAKMAKSNTGALMVIKGKDNWDRQTHGGIELNGSVTVPLLHSIFNPKAPGHDGAVLLEGNKLTRFGVHLPLSTRLKKISEGGTRHAAALGISEQCDALVIVVSEERGSISIAQDGYIQQLEDSSELKKHLDDFWDEHYQPAEHSASHWWKRSSPRTAIGAAVLAFIFWLALVYQPGTVSRTFNVPIEYRNLQSAHITLRDSLPVSARVILTGSQQAFETFDESQIVVSFNLASEEARDGVVEILPQHINLPPDLKLYKASPEKLFLTPQ